MATVFLVLGGNMGDRLDFLSKARKALEKCFGPLVKSSGLYQTAAWGKTNQPDFINQVVKINTNFRPQEVLTKILQIEQDLGRKRLEKWSERTIDIDILFYDQKVIDEPDLKIPHPNLHQRAFTLVPLVEIETNWLHPVLKKTASELLEQLDDRLSVQKLKL